MIRFALILTLIALGLFFILKQITSFFLHTQGANSKMKDDIKQLKKELRVYKGQLSPWEENDIELLSFGLNDRIKKGSINPIIKGVLTNIYQENLVAFGYKEYFNKSKKAIIVAMTSTEEYFYKVHKKDVEIFLNNEKLGTLSSDGSFYQGDALIANVDQSRSLSLLPIEIQGKKVASLVNPDGQTYENTRAVQLLKDLTDFEKTILVPLTLFELIYRTNHA